MDRQDLVGFAEETRGKLFVIVDELGNYIHSPRYDETYKLEWYPMLTRENLDKAAGLVEEFLKKWNELFATCEVEKL